MRPDVTANHLQRTSSGAVPRWLDRLSLVLMGVVALTVLVLALSYITAGAADNLAGVALILAGVLALPLLVVLLLHVAGLALRHSYPHSALAVAIATAILSSVLVLLVAGWVLLSI